MAINELALSRVRYEKIARSVAVTGKGRELTPPDTRRVINQALAGMGETVTYRELVVLSRDAFGRENREPDLLVADRAILEAGTDQLRRTRRLVSEIHRVANQVR